MFDHYARHLKATKPSTNKLALDPGPTKATDAKPTFDEIAAANPDLAATAVLKLCLSVPKKAGLHL